MARQIFVVPVRRHPWPTPSLSRHHRSGGYSRQPAFFAAPESCRMTESAATPPCVGAALRLPRGDQRIADSLGEVPCQCRASAARPPARRDQPEKLISSGHPPHWEWGGCRHGPWTAGPACPWARRRGGREVPHSGRPLKHSPAASSRLTPKFPDPDNPMLHDQGVARGDGQRQEGWSSSWGQWPDSWQRYGPGHGARDSPRP